MVARVLVPMDGSEMAETALRYALEIHPDAEIHVLNVVGEPSPMMGKALKAALEADVEEKAREQASAVLERAREIGREHDVDIQTEVAWGSPAKEIVAMAAEYDAVVVGSHSGSLADRLFVGNVARKVVRRSPVPVTVVR
ncbi:universal stress protein [Halolamina sp. CBA1230]|uniref:universal stress protein n=1 Tax=Halolamina sp. CBA1230 TaxID=1853690 RepID=UPI0009A205AE|nr:universal stress protein [Halolamina sp. CBA1230]QKY19342.1 universal stress protein [Halolamina sp. CBA1230]